MLDPNKIIQAMHARGYPVDVGDDVMNIIYPEGMELDGTPNSNRPNYWDDLRTLVRVHPSGQAELLGAWEATTEPGEYFTQNPMNDAGAFHIDLGPQTAWIPGAYHDAPALVQARSLHGTRDSARHYARDGKPDFGMFGVHHHKGYDYPKNNIGRSSAGCQVGRTVAGHMQFMDLLKRDRRWGQSGFVWTSTVMSASWITNAAPPILVTADLAHPSGRPLIDSLRHMFGGN
jgi:hypothetical protein